MEVLNMAYNIPLPDSPGTALGKAFTQGTGLYNMLIQHAMQKAQDKRAEAQNRRAEEMQPINIKHLLSQISTAEAASKRANELEPLQKMLLQAKAQSAQSNAAWNNMLMGNGGNSANIQPQINKPEPQKPNMGLYEGQGMPSAKVQDQEQEAKKTPDMNQIENEQILTEGNPNLYGMDRFAGIKGIPQVQTHYDTNGNLITRYPSGKITMQKIGPSDREKSFNKEFDKIDSKIVAGLQEQQLAGQDLNTSYEELDNAFNNPIWDKIHSGIADKFGERGRKFQLDIKRNTGTKEEKDLLATVDSVSNELVSKMAKVFKGPFRIAEQSLIERVKPQAYDTPEAARSKLNILRKALEKQQYINERIPDLIRKEKIPANDAFKIAFQEVGGKEFKDQLEEKYSSNKSVEKFNLIKAAKELNVPVSDIEHTAQLKGITPQQVVERYKELKNGS
jgi:hypothetical protein